MTNYISLKEAKREEYDKSIEKRLSVILDKVLNDLLKDFK